MLAEVWISEGGICMAVYIHCSVLWKVTVETGTVSSVLLRIAQRTQPKKLAAFMRRFVDYIVLSVSTPSPGQEDSDKLETVCPA